MNRLGNGLIRMLAHLCGRDPDLLQHCSNTVVQRTAMRGLITIGIYLVFFAAWTKVTGWWGAGLVIASLIVIFDILMATDIEYRKHSGHGGMLPGWMNKVRVLAALLLGVCMGFGFVIDQNQQTLDRESARRWAMETQPLFDARDARQQQLRMQEVAPLEQQRDDLRNRLPALQKQAEGYSERLRDLEAQQVEYLQARSATEHGQDGTAARKGSRWNYFNDLINQSLGLTREALSQSAQLQTQIAALEGQITVLNGRIKAAHLTVDDRLKDYDQNVLQKDPRWSANAPTDQIARARSLVELILGGGFMGAFLLGMAMLVVLFYVVLDTLLLASAGVGHGDNYHRIADAHNLLRDEEVLARIARDRARIDEEVSQSGSAADSPPDDSRPVQVVRLLDHRPRERRDPSHRN
ncbi:MAG: hypothetical protein MUE46_11810 [Xanthomonadales bacterium]|jgi:hypothetical protein|nr:hypothetical protein [Xanthomonadales bacterium]